MVARGLVMHPVPKPDACRDSAEDERCSANVWQLNRVLYHVKQRVARDSRESCGHHTRKGIKNPHDSSSASFSNENDERDQQSYHNRRSEEHDDEWLLICYAAHVAQDRASGQRVN